MLSALLAIISVFVLSCKTDKHVSNDISSDDPNNNVAFECRCNLVECRSAATANQSRQIDTTGDNEFLRSIASNSLRDAVDGYLRVEDIDNASRKRCRDQSSVWDYGYCIAPACSVAERLESTELERPDSDTWSEPETPHESFASAGPPRHRDNVGFEASHDCRQYHDFEVSFDGDEIIQFAKAIYYYGAGNCVVHNENEVSALVEQFKLRMRRDCVDRLFGSSFEVLSEENWGAFYMVRVSCSSF